MKNFGLYTAVIASLLIHILILLNLNWNIDEAAKDKPMTVDIIDMPKEKKKKQKKDAEIASDKNLDLKKKTEGESKNKINSSEDVPVPPEESKKPVPPQKSTAKKEQPRKEPEINRDKADNSKKTNEQRILKEKADEIPEETVNEKNGKESSKKKPKEKKLSEEQIAKILNPKDVIGKYGEKEKEQKKGEDSVNFNSMKVKYSSYFYKFRRNLYQVWNYPEQSVRNNEQGRVRIKFTINKDGSVENIKVVSSSGYPDLDRAAMDALHEMGKVPFGDSFDLERINVDGYFQYEIGGKYIY